MRQYPLLQSVSKFMLMLWLAIGSVLLMPVAHAVGEELLTADAMLSGNASTDDSSDTSADDAQTGTGELTDKDTVIETRPDRLKDSEIKDRIAGIFSEIDGLDKVTVSVNEGVVSLRGETPNEKKAQQAINLANRVSDVVTVEDNIDRTLDVGDNVTPVLQGLQTQAKAMLKALPLLLVAVMVFGLVAWFGAWLSRRKGLWQRITPNPFVAELLSQTIKVIFVILGLILGLSLIGAEAIIGTLLGGAGVIGIAVGFAVKDTIENYISSLMLSIRQPFRARDQVNINGQEGIVVRLTSRATILMTLDGNQLRIPNSEVFKGTILNYTKNPERRFTFDLGVDANDDPIAAIKVGLDAINALDFVLNDPKAIAIITQVGDSNIVLEFQVWVNQANTDFLKARSIAIREAKHALENQGFSLPEPIYRLRFNSEVEDAIKHLQSQAGSDNTVTTAKIIETDTQKQEEKQQAKARAKKVLGNADAEDVLDARPDRKLMQKVEEEIAESSGDADLLDSRSPQE